MEKLVNIIKISEESVNCDSYVKESLVKLLEDTLRGCGGAVRSIQIDSYYPDPETFDVQFRIIAHFGGKWEGDARKVVKSNG